MTLAELIARLGLREVARRAGVTPATLQRWLARGPSGRGATLLAGIARRHVAGKKAAESRKKAEVFRGGLALPPIAELPAKEVLPPSPPRSGSIESEGSQPYNTDRYTGELHIITVGQPALEVDLDGLASFSAQIYERSKRNYVRVSFLFFRFVTPSSLGKGELTNRKTGKWSEFWASTQVQSSKGAIADQVSSILDIGGEVGKQTLRDIAQRRIIWLEQIHVHTFDDNENPTSLATIVERELR